MPATSPNTAVSQEVEAETDISFTSVAFYAGVTVVCLVLLWLLIASLNQQPLFPWRPGLSRPFGWTAVTDSQQQFTFNLPAVWFVAHKGTDGFEEVAAFPQRLLAASAAEIQQTATPKMVATAEGRFILIYPVASLPEGFLDDLQNTPAVQAIEINQNLPDRRTITFSETLSSEGDDWLCKTHVIFNQLQTYALFVCQSGPSPLLETDEMNTIVDSFQTLLP